MNQICLYHLKKKQKIKLSLNLILSSFNLSVKKKKSFFLNLLFSLESNTENEFFFRV